MFGVKEKVTRMTMMMLILMMVLMAMYVMEMAGTILVQGAE